MRPLISEVCILIATAVLLITVAEAKDFTSKGTVGLTKEGEVRWTSVSIFQGHERWKSEGVQLSGPKSGKVIGNWFDR